MQSTHPKTLPQWLPQQSLHVLTERRLEELLLQASPFTAKITSAGVKKGS